jgi:arginine deiminase
MLIDAKIIEEFEKPTKEHVSSNADPYVSIPISNLLFKRDCFRASD